MEEKDLDKRKQFIKDIEVEINKDKDNKDIVLKNIFKELGINEQIVDNPKGFEILKETMDKIIIRNGLDFVEEGFGLSTEEFQKIIDLSPVLSKEERAVRYKEIFESDELNYLYSGIDINTDGSVNIQNININNDIELDTLLQTKLSLTKENSLLLVDQEYFNIDEKEIRDKRVKNEYNSSGINLNKFNIYYDLDENNQNNISSGYMIERNDNFPFATMNVILERIEGEMKVINLDHKIIKLDSLISLDEFEEEMDKDTKEIKTLSLKEEQDVKKYYYNHKTKIDKALKEQLNYSMPNEIIFERE